MKNITIGEFLTDHEIEQASHLYLTAQPGTFARLVDEQIITPNIERINQALGQENDARYLAYAVEFAFTKATYRLN
jgi:hypothetical protein